jgi:hypothetical protein
MKLRMSHPQEKFASSCQLDDGNDLSKLLSTTVAANKEWIDRKSANLVRKIVGNASMIQVTVTDTKAFEEKIPGLELHDDMNLKVFQKPFLVTGKEYSWAWYPNAYPWPGLGQALVVVSGSFFFKLLSVDGLCKAGMTSLTALDHFLPSPRDLKKTLEPVEQFDIVLSAGESMYIAPGFIPIVIPFPQEDQKTDVEAVAMVVQLFDLDKAKKVPKEAFHQVASNLTTAINNFSATSTTWKEAKPLLESWIEKVTP